jgi:peptidoglycan hydrolase-like protein with peptidoglycan-binding domain
MDAIKKLIQNNNWDLTLPFTVRGLVIDDDNLTPAIRSSGGSDAIQSRHLSLTQPFMTGSDVREVQKALIEKGGDLGEDGVDGIFGTVTDEAVRLFQKQANLRVDGIVGDATRAALGIDTD